MKRRKIIISLIILTTSILACLFFVYSNIYDNEQINNETVLDIENTESSKNNQWIIKWKNEYDLDMVGQVDILDWIPDQGILRVKLNDSINVNEWINQWKDNPEIEYIQPNITCNISEIPNDKYYNEQYYLEQIKVEKAWDTEYSNEVIVAILDTGIDNSHPDLQGKIISGINILDNSALPIDDNGHGTNVSGIVAAISNNSAGISGITRNTKIMPVKVLDQNGKSDSFYVGQGIRYAVENGADIILLASGETIYTPFMAEAVDYAEENNVLIVAATGNTGSELNYPAALSNVLSVGAVDRNDNYLEYSNYGQQIDVMAPGEGIFTTNIGGGYISKSGTSMAAPQVAGVAAILRQKYPDLSAKEIADIIRFSADDIGVPYWDTRTGYGRINVEKALTLSMDVLADGYGPNQASRSAHVFPLGGIFRAELKNSTDVDWYWFDIPYDGTMSINFSLEKRLDYAVNIEIYTNEQIIKEQNKEELEVIRNMLNIAKDNANAENLETIGENEQISVNELPYATYSVRNSEEINLDLTEGKYYIKINYPDERKDIKIKPFNYTLSNQYVIYEDAYEFNDKPWNSYGINNISEIITGTFNKNYDEDWFKIFIPKNGTLTAGVEVDTKRIDPVLWMQPIGGIGTEIDYNSAGKSEFGYINVTPGEYLIRVSDYNNNIVNNEYILNLVFKSTDRDSYEPNNISTQATKLAQTMQIVDGSIFDCNDYDWFEFETQNQTYTKFNLTADKAMNITFFNNDFDVISSEETVSFEDIRILEEGTYYLRLDSSEAKSTYNYLFTSIELIGDFIDIQDHYALDLILKYYDKGFITGYDDYTFRPEQGISRGEVAVFISSILQLEDIAENPYIDVTADNEIYLAINKVRTAGIMPEFEDNTFRPDEIISQENLTIILDNIYKELDINYIKEITTALNLVPYSTISRAEFLVIYDELDAFYDKIINIPDEKAQLEE